MRGLVGPAEALGAMRSAFAALHRGEVTQPANMDFAFPAFQGEAHLKGAHVHGAPYWAVKAATGFWSNRDRGLPITSGLFLVFSVFFVWYSRRSALARDVVAIFRTPRAE